ncbi:hypothetical protein [Erwinia sp. 198]|uniref:hypothetical protein n=1 Tax=Erwinia sp. 198 TaxID=2022746 RepID=UPI000F67CD9E|nr:hypothetical protein [Erwinia sp. 198]RRZ88118.1 hypothetical protein EGK14_18185 [Erwinia sp. 198]
MDASEGVIAAIIACNAVKDDYQNRRLNANYQRYLAGMSTDVKQNFMLSGCGLNSGMKIAALLLLRKLAAR